MFFLKIIAEIRQKISEDVLDMILNKKNTKPTGLKSERFGKKIPYHSAEVSWPKTDMLHDMNAKNFKNITKRFDELLRAPQIESTVRKTEVGSRL